MSLLDRDRDQTPNQPRPEEDKPMTTYKGYEIHSGCSREPIFWIAKNGKDLFFGIKSRKEAEKLVDGWVIAVKVLG